MGGWRRWAAVAALLALGGAAAAQGPEQAVIDQLARQGYVEFEVSRTLLGRIRVVALGPNGERREIVFNPATGEILRDLVSGSGMPQVLERPLGEPEEEPPVEAPADAVATVSAGAPGSGGSGEAADDGGSATGPEGGDADGAEDGPDVAGGDGEMGEDWNAEDADGAEEDPDAGSGDEASGDGGSGEDGTGQDGGGGNGGGAHQKPEREDGAAGSRDPGAGDAE